MSLLRLGLSSFSLLLLAACDRPPEVYSPPEQRHPVVGYNPGPEAMMVFAADKVSKTRELGPDASLQPRLRRPWRCSWRPLPQL